MPLKWHGSSAVISPIEAAQLIQRFQPIYGIGVTA